MNEQTTLKNAIGKTIHIFTEEAPPPCPPNEYLGALINVEIDQITVNCKFGYTKQNKTISFDGENCKIKKILLEESQTIIYEQQKN